MFQPHSPDDLQPFTRDVLAGACVPPAATLARLRALQVLASLDGGIFTFEPNVAAPDRTLSLRREVALTHMLFDQDGWAEVLKVFPEWTSTLRFSARWSEAQPVTQQQYRALRMVTPGVSIRGMLERLAFRPAGDPSTLKPRELLDTLRPFVQAGLVEVVPA